MDVIICAESAGLRWPSWDSCTGREANQRHSTLLLQRDNRRGETGTVHLLLSIPDYNRLLKSENVTLRWKTLSLLSPSLNQLTLQALRVCVRIIESLRRHITLLCVYVPAPEGKACCKKTAAEFGPVVSGVSACSRHKRLPTGLLSPLHEETQMIISNEVNHWKRFSSTSDFTFALLRKHHFPHGSQQHVEMPVIQFHAAAQSVSNKYLQRS